MHGWLLRHTASSLDALHPAVLYFLVVSSAICQHMQAFLLTTTCVGSRRDLGMATSNPRISRLRLVVPCAGLCTAE